MREKQEKLHPKESVIFELRQHTIVLLKPLIVNIAALIILLGLCRAIKNYLFLLVYMLPMTIMIWEVMLWRRSKYVFTNKRILRKNALANAENPEIYLAGLENIYPKQSMLGRMFNYGHINLELEGAQVTTRLEFLTNPAKVVSRITRLRTSL